MTTTNSTPAFKAFPFAGFVFFTPWVTSYTGSKKLTPEDIGIKVSDLPPQDLASLGAMHTCDPKKLQPFESARNAQALACLEFGTRCLGGFAVPRDKAEACAQKLDAITEQFYEYKATFLSGFVLDREQWISLPAFAKWTDRIRERLHSAAYVDDRIQCGYEVFTIGSMSDLSDDPANPSPLAAGALRAANAIGMGALDEIAVLAKALVRDSFMDDGIQKTEVTQKILRPFRRMQDKLLALSFADPRLKDVGNYVSKVLASLPKQGKMSGQELDAIYGLALRLSEPQQILAVASISNTSFELDEEAQMELIEMTTTQAPAPELVADSTPVFDDAAGPAVPQPADQQGLQVGAVVYDEC